MAYFSVYFSNSGAPHTGLAPTITLRDISDGSVVLNAIAMVEKGSGWYAYDYAAYDYTKEYVGFCYAETVLTDEPYKPISTGASPLFVAEAVWAEVIPAPGSAGSAAAKLNLAATGGSLSGSGAISWPYTILDSVSGEPIADVDVWVTTDLAGTNVVASGKTDQNGLVTFDLDAGTAYFWRQKSGVNFTNPNIQTVA